MGLSFQGDESLIPGGVLEPIFDILDAPSLKHDLVVGLQKGGLKGSHMVFEILDSLAESIIRPEKIVYPNSHPVLYL